jgi:double-stranded uracil-DNA glycosylase
MSQSGQNGRVRRPPGRPTRDDLEAAEGRSIPDVIARDLDVLFCGVNPGLWSAAVQHHFARPGNRFWKALHLSGFTPTLVGPDNERDLLNYHLGITNIVDRATRAAIELPKSDLQEGAKRLEAKVLRWRPRCVAVLGMGAYRTAFGRSKAALGLQPELIGRSNLWLLANPSGAQARYQLSDVVEQLRELRSFVAKR